MGNGGETKDEGKLTTGRFRASIRVSDSLLVRHSPYKGWGGGEEVNGYRHGTVVRAHLTLCLSISMLRPSCCSSLTYSSPTEEVWVSDVGGVSSTCTYVMLQHTHTHTHTHTTHVSTHTTHVSTHTTHVSTHTLHTCPHTHYTHVHTHTTHTLHTHYLCCLATLHHNQATAARHHAVHTAPCSLL